MNLINMYKKLYWERHTKFLYNGTPIELLEDIHLMRIPHYHYKNYLRYNHKELDPRIISELERRNMEIYTKDLRVRRKLPKIDIKKRKAIINKRLVNRCNSHFMKILASSNNTEGQ